eukprot:1756543-Prymnesium_polylepis.1
MREFADRWTLHVTGTTAGVGAATAELVLALPEDVTRQATTDEQGLEPLALQNHMAQCGSCGNASTVGRGRRCRWATHGAG